MTQQVARATLPVSVSVVVVAHDSGDDLARCAASVLAQAPALELIVVDNASVDGALQRLPADPRVRLLLNHDNRGFARGCNQGATLARGEVLLFLNPDCVLPPGAIAGLLQVLRSDPAFGVVGAQLLDPDGTPQRASYRRDPLPWRAVGLAFGVGARTTPDPRLRHAQAAPVDSVSGALMMLPRDLFGAVDGFDEGYVLHCEDLDLCRRVRLHGRVVVVAPQVRVLHAKGTSSRRRPLWVEWQKHRGMWRYFTRFDAAATAAPWRALLWLGLWAHFALAAPRAWLRSRLGHAG